MSWPHIDELAGRLIPYLLPFLVSAGKTVGGQALKGIGHKLGGKASQALQDLWLRLRPEVESQPAIKTVAEQLAGSPQNHALQDELRGQLRQLLEKDPEFMKEVAELLDRVVAQGVMISNVDIDVHGGGKLEGIAIEDLGDVRESGIREIRSDVKVRETKEGTSTTGIRIGRLGGTTKDRHIEDEKQNE